MFDFFAAVDRFICGKRLILIPVSNHTRLNGLKFCFKILSQGLCESNQGEVQQDAKSIAEEEAQKNALLAKFFRSLHYYHQNNDNYNISQVQNDQNKEEQAVSLSNVKQKTRSSRPQLNQNTKNLRAMLKPLKQTNYEFNNIYEPYFSRRRFFK